MRPILAVLAASVALPLVARVPDPAASPQAAAAAPAARPAVVAWTGPSSAIRTREFALVRDAKSWRELWERHRGDAVERSARGWPLAPTIDFDRFVVLAVFFGERTNHDGVELVEWTDDGASTRVRIDGITFQTASFDGPDPGVAGTPFGLFVLPRLDHEIVVEENVQGLIGREAVWKRVWNGKA